MPQATSQSLVTAQNVLPIVRRTDASIWEEAEKLRDGLFASFEDECRERGFEAAVLKSREFEQPAWVSLEAWVPSEADGVTRRRFASVTIFAKAFHKTKFEYTVVVSDGEWKRSRMHMRKFDRDDVSRTVAFVLGATPKPPKLKAPWRPNRVDVLKRDWLGLHAKATVHPKRRPVVLSSGKPKAEPRRLVLIDSWQAMIPGLGEDAELLRDRFMAVLADSPIRDSVHRVEKIGYWGLDDIVNREQIVITLRRGIVFCHIYPYNSELYVGWNAHLNAGQWVETTVAKGKSRATGEHTTVKSVESGVQRLTEYDLIDLSCLSEWIHGQLVQIIQHQMKERDIDKDLVNFNPIRGNRQDVGGMNGDEPAKPGRHGRSRVKRTG